MKAFEVNVGINQDLCYTFHYNSVCTHDQLSSCFVSVLLQPSSWLAVPCYPWLWHMILSPGALPLISGPSVSFSQRTFPCKDAITFGLMAKLS